MSVGTIGKESSSSRPAIVLMDTMNVGLIDRMEWISYWMQATLVHYTNAKSMIDTEPIQIEDNKTMDKMADLDR